MRELTKPELPNLYQRQTKVAIDSNGRQLQKARLCGKYDVVEYFSHFLYILVSLVCFCFTIVVAFVTNVV